MDRPIIYSEPGHASKNPRSPSQNLRKPPVPSQLLRPGTIALEPKYNHSVEILSLSYDLSLEITFGINLMRNSLKVTLTVIESSGVAGNL